MIKIGGGLNIAQRFGWNFLLFIYIILSVKFITTEIIVQVIRSFPIIRGDPGSPYYQENYTWNCGVRRSVRICLGYSQVWVTTTNFQHPRNAAVVVLIVKILVIASILLALTYIHPEQALAADVYLSTPRVCSLLVYAKKIQLISNSSSVVCLGLGSCKNCHFCAELRLPLVIN